MTFVGAKVYTLFLLDRAAGAHAGHDVPCGLYLTLSEVTDNSLGRGPQRTEKITRTVRLLGGRQVPASRAKEIKPSFKLQRELLSYPPNREQTLSPGCARGAGSPMEMQTERQGNLLLVTLTGKVDLSLSVRLLNQAFDIAAETRAFKILFNALAVTGTLSTFERYELGSKVAAHITHLGTNPKIAFVGVSPTVNGFAVRVAQNRDVAVELFRDVPEGLAWLGKWPAPEKPGGVSP
jgi:hypothetical protein